MNTRTGEIASLEHFKATLSPDELARCVRPVDEAALSDRLKKTLVALGRGKVGRNSPCPCGSRDKFKRCCMDPASQLFANPMAEPLE